MFDKLLASIGVGAAKVDTRIHDSSLTPGETVEGVVHIRGGAVAQPIDAVNVSLYTNYRSSDGDDAVTLQAELARVRVAEPFTVEPGAEHSIPFRLAVPYETPLTIGYHSVWVQTSLNIPQALDPSDTDRLQIDPHPLQARFLEGLRELGFHFHASQVERHRKLSGRFPFVQELEFKPGYGTYGRISELEVIFQLSDYGLEALVEMDKRASGLQMLFDIEPGERYGHIRFGHDDLRRGNWAADIDRLIRSRMP